jgi:hypothetical protein
LGLSQIQAHCLPPLFEYKTPVATVRLHTARVPCGGPITVPNPGYAVYENITKD